MADMTYFLFFGVFIVVTLVRVAPNWFSRCIFPSIQSSFLHHIL